MIRKKDLDEKIEDYFDSLLKQINRIESRAVTVEKENKQLQKQLQCAAKGHNFIFEKSKKLSLWDLVHRKGIYQFKCTNCDLTITKTGDELTPEEKRALKDLGILEENENGESPTTKS